DGLSAEDQRVAERIFRCLTTMESGRAVRRPARFAKILAVLQAKNNFYREQVESVIWRFASPESNFLVLPAGAHIRDEGVVDITDESLIRKWTTLGGWAEAEAESAKWYQSLVRCAELYEAGTGGLWRDPELKGALLRSRHDQWNQAWADQYCPGFEAATKFL